ncbi:MAG: SWIM zinc finger family protein [Steroidobacteraceae bacterium]
MNWRNYARKPSVAEQRQRVARDRQRFAKRLVKGAREPSPIVIDGRTIARSFWGKAWCQNLESYRDYEYRLPRGRSYLRNGAVLDLEVAPGRVTALVAGSRPNPYEVAIKIKPVAAAQWTRLKSQCAGGIGSLIDLLEGRLSDQVMQVITHREQGLFPKPAEIEMSCSCPDWATMCKHVAAVLYGVGSRFDR